MKFWTPKIRTEEKNWSIVLNPLRGELEKKRVAEKISELFRLSFEESRELVQSTPLILLDELPHEAACQIQNIFQEIRADVTLTSDALVKRRCYRAVWPEPPNLSFLQPSSLSLEPETEKIEEIPQETVPQAPPPSFSSNSVQEQVETLSDSYHYLEKKYRDLEGLYGERTREIEELKRNFEKGLKDRAEKTSVELRAHIEEWEERYQNLKEEYQETKGIYEEKILNKEKEFGQLKEQSKQLEPWREKAVILQKQNEEQQEAKTVYEEKLLQQSSELQALREQLKQIGLWQEKAANLEKQNKGFLERLNALESANVTLGQTVREQSDAVNLWREKYQGIAQKSERFEALYEEERKRREQAEESRHQIGELAERTRQDIQNQMAETERWRKKFQEIEENQKRLEEELARFSAERSNENKQLREANHELEIQLESSQRQAKDLLQRVEQQDLIEKRTRLANELGGKEAQLRELALETERLRQEIQDKELRFQTLGSEQANLEREVLEVKQAQRHLLEQSKSKEKAKQFRRPTKALNGGDAAPENA